jgi:hypothetical protein
VATAALSAAPNHEDKESERAVRGTPGVSVILIAELVSCGFAPSRRVQAAERVFTEPNADDGARLLTFCRGLSRRLGHSDFSDRPL